MISVELHGAFFFICDSCGRDGFTRGELVDGKKVMAEMGLTPPSTSYKSFSVMGKTFDPTKPDDYLAGFKIRKAS